MVEKSENPTLGYVLISWRSFLNLSWNGKGYVLLLLALLSGVASFVIYSFLPQQTAYPSYSSRQEIYVGLSQGLLVAFLLLSWAGCLFITPRWLKSKSVEEKPHD